MKSEFGFSNFVNEIKLLAEKAPRTEALATLIREVDLDQICRGESRVLRPFLKTPVVAATDPWSEVEYQSLYIRGDDPEDRIVLQEPTVKDPMVCVMVLKAARLSGESGMVYCGKPEALNLFAQKLPEYEKRGIDLDEGELLECLAEAAEADGLKVIFQRLSVDHGGQDVEEEYE